VISFIVPAYNEERGLGATLRSIHEAAAALGEPYELIVVDDASTDRTAAVAESQRARVVPVSHRKISATRNSGAKASTGEILIFVDADTTVDATVVGAALRALREGAVGGGASVRFDGPLPFYARMLAAMILWTLRRARLAAGCFFFCTRDTFDAVGGFDERFYAAEEIYLSRALKRRGRFVMLAEHVTTSARKIRTHSPWEMLSLFTRLTLGGTRAVKRREGLEHWYQRRGEEER
jgi:glycosyltransferase involved in cell wall biosynthesis